MKVVFLGLNAGEYGGVSGVNHLLAKALVERGHRVSFAYLCTEGEEKAPEGVRVFCASPRPWHLTLGSEIRERLSQKRFFSALGLYRSRKKEERENEKSREAVRTFLLEEEPEAVIVSHYLLLEAVPEALLPRTFFHAHTAFSVIRAERAYYDTLVSYRNRIRFVFLSQKSLRLAREAGFERSFCLYNPVSPAEKAKGKDVVVLTRLSEEKRIPLMIELFKKALAKTQSSARLLIYGEGPDREKARLAIGEEKRILLMGKTEDPDAAWHGACLTLCTSAYEGFSLSLLEAAARGVPALTLPFEAAEEEILNGVTGAVARGEEEFVEALCRYLSDPGRIRRQGENARAWSRNFDARTLAEKWEEVLSLA